MKGDYSVLQDAPKLGGSSLWAPKPVIYCCPRGSILQSYGWFFKGFLKGQIGACINAFKSQVIDHNYRPFPQIVKPQSLKKHNKHISFSKV